MARLPSLAALLGLVAVAGYQHRDKIGEFIKGLSGPSAGGGGGTTDVKGGLGELVDRFRNAGQGEKVDSWVGTGANASIDDRQMEATLGSDMVDRLVQQTGLTRDELLSRLSKVLPETVDKMTPEGKLPA